jgi:hypothetical protein
MSGVCGRSESADRLNVNLNGSFVCGVNKRAGKETLRESEGEIW